MFLNAQDEARKASYENQSKLYVISLGRYGVGVCVCYFPFVLLRGNMEPAPKSSVSRIICMVI